MTAEVVTLSMAGTVDQIELVYRDIRILVRRHHIAGQEVYWVRFADCRPPLVITRAMHAGKYHFWTSVPEGRQAEAGEIGSLIAGHLKPMEK